MSSNGDDPSLTADDFGVPIGSDLQDLRYPHSGVHLLPIAERLAYEEDMRRWIGIGAGQGYSREDSMIFSLYL